MPDESDNGMLAGEYALGTLAPAERESVRQARKKDPALNAEIEVWETRLSPLLADIASVAPSERLWNAIEVRIATPMKSVSLQMMERRMHRWRQGTIAASVLAVVAFGSLHSATQLSPSPQAVALLQKTNDPTAFLLRLNAPGHTVTVNIQTATLPENASYELWIIAGDKAPPKPIGVLTAKSTTLPFDASIIAPDPLSNATFAISLEPKGGSPTGLPTGPVISTGKLTLL